MGSATPRQLLLLLLALAANAVAAASSGDESVFSPGLSSEQVRSNVSAQGAVE